MTVEQQLSSNKLVKTRNTWMKCSSHQPREWEVLTVIESFFALKEYKEVSHWDLQTAASTDIPSTHYSFLKEDHT